MALGFSRTERRGAGSNTVGGKRREKSRFCFFGCVPQVGRTRVRRIARYETTRKFSWLQAVEKSRNADEISLRAVAERPRSRATPGGSEFGESVTTKGAKLSWLQTIEKSRNGEGISLRSRSAMGGAAPRIARSSNEPAAVGGQAANLCVELGPQRFHFPSGGASYQPRAPSGRGHAI